MGANVLWMPSRNSKGGEKANDNFELDTNCGDGQPAAIRTTTGAGRRVRGLRNYYHREVEFFLRLHGLREGVIAHWCRYSEQQLNGITRGLHYDRRVVSGEHAQLRGNRLERFIGKFNGSDTDPHLRTQFLDIHIYPAI
jgi:hypothetical protein